MVKHIQRKKIVICVPGNDGDPMIRVVTYLRELVQNKRGSIHGRLYSETESNIRPTTDLKYSNIE